MRHLKGQPLSPREQAVATLIAQGVRSSEIGVRLGISVKTVATYRSRILDKLGVDSNVAIAFWVRDQKNETNNT
jgi:DNA-binding NarL/FixJ family response regulator